MRYYKLIIIFLIVILLCACTETGKSRCDESTIISENANAGVEEQEILENDTSKYGDLIQPQNTDTQKQELQETSDDTDSGKEVQKESTDTDSANDESEEVVIAVTGDLCFADNWEILQNANSEKKSVEECFSPEIIHYMNDADICLCNNEFCISDRGENLQGKLYTFRAQPENTKYWNIFGTDIVSLANNHVYDYGKDAFLDTVQNLENEGIAVIGGGRNEERAYAPYLTSIHDKKIAFLAASRAEKNYMTPVSQGDQPGIAGTYDNERFLEEIRLAKESASYVIVYVHWGTEYSEVLEENQIETAHEYIDAGADAVIGAHAHILQGAEFYHEKPILYNLGNFWFNMKEIDTALLLLHINDEGISPQLIPCVQKDGTTICLEGTEEGVEILKYVEEMSDKCIDIDERGYLKSTTR